MAAWGLANVTAPAAVPLACRRLGSGCHALGIWVRTWPFGSWPTVRDSQMGMRPIRGGEAWPMAYCVGRGSSAFGLKVSARHSRHTAWEVGFDKAPVRLN